MKHCLVVDDSGSIRKVAQRILQAEKFRTSEATTRAEAVEQCRREMPDCIIVDWQMPDGDAMAFMGQLRSLPGGDKVKILYMTSENDPVHVARALRSGADAHMMKPFDRETFLGPLVAAGVLQAA
jgi:two-component system chemotaxis response regulator CheY